MKYISPNLSEYADPFLKYQTKTCKSYVRYTSECLLKLKSLPTVPSTSILFIIDVNSPYTNIDDEEGVDVSCKYSEKKISSVIKVEISQSIKTISFLDVCSTPNQRTLSTAVFPKPLNTCHTEHRTEHKTIQKLVTLGYFYVQFYVQCDKSILYLWKICFNTTDFFNKSI